jgi:hypothetical protein
MIDVNSLTKTEKIIYEGIDINTSQSGHTREEIFLDIQEKLYNKRAIAVQSGGLVLYVRGESKYMARMDLFIGKDISPYGWITDGHKINKWIFENTETQLMYGISSNKRFIKGVRRGGWKLIGTMPKSFWDGEKFIDNYIYYCQKEEFLEFLKKRNKNNNL